MEAKLFENEVWISTLQDTIPRMGDTFTQILDEKNRLEKENVELKKEVEALKKKLAEATEEEDPEERIMFGSDEEEVPLEEWEGYLARKEARRAKEAKRRNTTPLACIDRVKMR